MANEAARGASPIASRGGRARENVSRHVFLGANTVVRAMRRDHAGELGVRAPAAAFDAGIARDRAFLGGAATLEIVAAERTGEVITARVRVASRTGHKLPAGFPSRRVILRFAVEADDGRVLFELGRPNADGSIEGVDTDRDSRSVEPHHATIVSVDQVQVYEATMADAAGNVTHTLTEGSRYVQDNRLLPLGLDPLAAPAGTEVAGAAADDADFAAGGDTVEHRVAVPAATGYALRAELLYQPLAFGHLQDLFGDDDLPEIARFRRCFEAAERKSETIASASRRVAP